MAEDLADPVVEGRGEAVAADEGVEAEEVVAGAVSEDSIRRSRTEQCFIREETERWTRRTYSLTGAPVVKPAYSTNRFGLSFTGSPSIPGLVKAEHEAVRVS